MKGFRQVIDDCALIDLGYKGGNFTWWNNKEGEHSICERLDRVLVNHSWCRGFPYAKIIHSVAAHSDHVSIVLQIEGDFSRFKGPKPFRFEAMWVKTEGYGRVIEQAWHINSGQGPIGDVL